MNKQEHQYALPPGFIIPPPTSSRKVDTASVGGKHYDITGPERVNICSDMISLSKEDFAVKWAKVLRFPESIKALHLDLFDLEGEAAVARPKSGAVVGDDKPGVEVDQSKAKKD